jgi:hypothetical protein
MKVLYIIIACLLGLNNVFINYKVGGISYDRLIELVLLCVLVKDFIRNLAANRFFAKFILFIGLFFLLQLFVDLRLAMTDVIDVETVMRDIARFISFVAFAYLFLFIINRDIRYINIVLFFNFCSFLFAAAQHPSSPVAQQVYEIRQKLFASVDQEDVQENIATEEEYIESDLGARFRVSGPFNTPINLAYLLLSSFFLSAFMYHRKKRSIYLINCIFIVFVSLLSQTRSVILAELLFTGGLLFYIQNAKLRVFFRAALCIGVAAAIVFAAGKSFDDEGSGDPKSRLLKFNDEGSDRPLLWLTGLYAIGTHPFGMSPNQYMQAKKEMYLFFKSPSILMVEAHNGFINLGFHYTIIGYIVFGVFAVFLVKATRKLRPPESTMFGLFLLAYIWNAAFHNNFIFDSDYDVLMVVTLLCFEANAAVAKVADDEEKPVAVREPKYQKPQQLKIHPL